MKILTIAVDFDGTIIYENYPALGDPVPGAKEAINALFDMGHTIIINSCRSGPHEDLMREYLHTTGINYHHINENPAWRIEKYGLDCRKIGADLYIDDRNIFCQEIYWPEIFAEIIRFSGAAYETIASTLPEELVIIT
jgi:hydroxymethylpyrimidine pyrophosphatase-like HAD family hydrolase